MAAALTSASPACAGPLMQYAPPSGIAAEIAPGTAVDPCPKDEGRDDDDGGMAVFDNGVVTWSYDGEGARLAAYGGYSCGGEDASTRGGRWRQEAGGAA